MLWLGRGGGGGGGGRVSVESGIYSTYVWFCLYLFCYSFFQLPTFLVLDCFVCMY